MAHMTAMTGISVKISTNIENDFSGTEYQRNKFLKSTYDIHYLTQNILRGCINPIIGIPKIINLKISF